ncbi:jg9920 [Pararge aegeria aegeria]|uniref:Jg9920 protein n=1 Tax=Pararge aegeria aegeria TaxID=348720 RepID=A0A8S4RAG1_9NEOP|nr:jg9920 [Pararge aegeria aegeria]
MYEKVPEAQQPGDELENRTSPDALTLIGSRNVSQIAITASNEIAISYNMCSKEILSFCWLSGDVERRLASKPHESLRPRR